MTPVDVSFNYRFCIYGKSHQDWDYKTMSDCHINNYYFCWRSKK